MTEAEHYAVHETERGTYWAACTHCRYATSKGSSSPKEPRRRVLDHLADRHSIKAAA